MIDLEILKQRGIDYEGLKKVLAPDAGESPSGRLTDKEPVTKSEKVAKLRNIIRQRIQAGREGNISTHRVHHALDLAWETPFRQVSPTLLHSLMDRDASQDDVQRTLTSWGYDLKQVISEYPDPKAVGKTIKRVNVPAFYQIFVPLVRSYVTIRLAKLMNDRRRTPYYKYEPVISTPESRLQNEVVTTRVETMCQQYDYWSVDKQACFQMLHYGTCYKFPMEEWHEECQETGEDDKFKRPKKDKDGKVVEGRYERVVKEGLRYHTPHPSRTFVDEAHRPSTYNSDSGCEFIGYWKVVRYRDIKNNPNFYNTDKVNIGATEWWTNPNTTTFFNSVYNTCTINYPRMPGDENQDREARMANSYYTKDMDDTSVVYTEYFQKLVPSEFGLGDYDYPVWFRFVVAADDTILYAAPLPYCPAVYYGYDADELRAQNASLSLEILPFQDHFSNLMTQYLLTVKQNLANATFVNTDIVSAQQFKQLANLGQNLYGSRNFFAASFKKFNTGQNDIKNSFESFRFPSLDTNAALAGMRVILDTLERVLVMSSQEVAQAASHEQTAREINNIQGATSTRLTFTGIPLDIARGATMRQIYYGLMAYGEDEFYAQIPLEKTLSKEDLEKLGFTYDKNETEMLRSRRLTVRAKKKAIMLESFTYGHDGESRANNVEAGQAMLNTLLGLVGSPLFQVLGPDQCLTLINASAQLMGYPRDFKLQNMSDSMDQGQMAQIVQMLEQLQAKIQEDIQQGVIIPLADGQKKLGEGLEKVAQELSQHTDQMDSDMKVRDEKGKLQYQQLDERIKNLLEIQRKSPQLLPPSTPIDAPNATILLSPNPTSSGR